MLRTQTDRSLCALAQMAPRGQAALLSGLGHALTQATGRQPDDLCHRKGTSHLPDHGRGRRRLTKPKSFRSGVLVQNVQTPGSEAVGSRGVTAEPFAQKRIHFGGPVGRMVATRNPRGPGGLLMPGTGLKVIAIDFIEASPPQAEPLGSRARFEFAGSKQG